MHVPLVMSASWGRTVMPDTHVTHQPASCPHTRSVQICWDGALTVYVAVVAGPWVFGTDVPYEAMGIGYHLYVDGMPVLPIAVYVLCGTGGGECSAACVQSMAPTVHGNLAIL